MTSSSLFSRLARETSRRTGHAGTFALAILVILVWAVTGPIFGWSDTWQLVINTGTTIVTFLMVFLIQNTQNRDSEALQLKLDELIRVTKRARNDLLDLEECSEEELTRLKEEFARLAQKRQATRDAASGRRGPQEVLNSAGGTRNGRAR
jgi:low affinity Fe/Cu permease